MAVAAMAIAAGSYGLMSFAASASSDLAQATYWFPVDSEGNISPTPSAPDEECETEASDNFCSVAFPTPMAPVTHISQTTLGSGSQPVSGVLYRPD